MAKVTIPQALIPVPATMAHLARDPDHYNLPVPYFVGLVRDKSGQLAPDYRTVEHGVREACQATNRCWICGKFLTKPCSLVIGPMCLINRISSEPAAHQECARYAARACPFLSTPNRKRREKDLPAGIIPPPGDHSPDNPGAAFVVHLPKPPKRRKDDLYHFPKILDVEVFRHGEPVFGLDRLPEFAAGARRLCQLAADIGPRNVAGFMAQLTPATRLLVGEKNFLEAGRRILDSLQDLPHVRGWTVAAMPSEAAQ